MSLEKIKTALEDIVELNTPKLGVEYCTVLEIDNENNICTAQSMLSNNIFTNVRLSTYTTIDDVDKGFDVKPKIGSHIYVLKINEYDNIALSYSEIDEFNMHIGDLALVYSYDEESEENLCYIEYNKEDDFSGHYLKNTEIYIQSASGDDNSRVYLKNKFLRIESNTEDHTTIIEVTDNGIKMERDDVNMKTAFQDLKTALGAMTVPTPNGPSGTPNNIADINSALDDIIDILD